LMTNSLLGMWEKGEMDSPMNGPTWFMLNRRLSNVCQSPRKDHSCIHSNLLLWETKRDQLLACIVGLKANASHSSITLMAKEHRKNQVWSDWQCDGQKCHSQVGSVCQLWWWKRSLCRQVIGHRECIQGGSEWHGVHAFALGNRQMDRKLN